MGCERPVYRSKITANGPGYSRPGGVTARRLPGIFSVTSAPRSPRRFMTDSTVGGKTLVSRR